MTTTAHRISDNGQTIICQSSADARCRMAPDCDTETWDSDGCHNHRDPDTDMEGAHPVTPGHDCWLAECHINPAGLEDTGPEEYPTIYPGAPVHLEFHGPEEGCTWHYTEDHTIPEEAAALALMATGDDQMED